MFTPVNQQMVGHGDTHQAMINNHPYTDPLAVYSNPHWPTPYNPLPMSMGGDPSTGAMNPTNPISQLPMTGYYQGPYIAGPPFQDYQLPSYDPPTLRMVPETERAVLHRRHVVTIRDQGAPYPCQPPIDSEAHVAPYAQGQANVSVRLHVRELVHGAEFTKGIIKVSAPPSGTFPPTALPIPPPHTPIFTPTQHTATSRELQSIYHDMHELVKVFVLQINVMLDGKEDLTPLLTEAIQQVVQDNVKKNVEEGAKKLDNAASYMHSLFKDCAASHVKSFIVWFHCPSDLFGCFPLQAKEREREEEKGYATYWLGRDMGSVDKKQGAHGVVLCALEILVPYSVQDAYDLWASAAIFHGLSEIDWKQLQIHALHCS
ncbi:hypothetical protein BDN67DRAFT_985063 [Paxillus ammoniavirescens]|nr:hypothetical protein BDN67DRAFT_985063 [Paxillus ammoniavirescens]